MLAHVLHNSEDNNLQDRFKIYIFSRRFYPKQLTVLFRLYIFFCQYVCSLVIEPTTFALLMQCSITEPQEHKFKGQFRF